MDAQLLQFMQQAKTNGLALSDILYYNWYSIKGGTQSITAIQELAKQNNLNFRDYTLYLIEQI